MAKGSKAKSELRGKARMRAEIVEAMRGLHKVGAVGDDELQKTTMRMLARMRCALSPAEIVGVRERTGVSQAVLAAYMNVAVSTVSQWERGERRPTGAALKFLHVVKRGGIDALR